MPGSRKGFTSIELLAVLFVAGVLTALAVPRLAGLMHHWRLKAAVQDLYQAFQAAKTSAILRNRACALVFNQPLNGVTCGYVVFVDEKSDLEYDEDDGDVVLQSVRWEDYPGVLPSSDSRGKAGVGFSKNSHNLPAVGFHPNGLPFSPEQGLGMGSICLENKRGERLAVILSSAGRLRIE